MHSKQNHHKNLFLKTSNYNTPIMFLKYKCTKVFFCFCFGMIFGHAVAQDQSLYQEKSFVHNTDTLNYRILYPADFATDKQYPLVLFLHGAGERGNDN